MATQGDIGVFGKAPIWHWRGDIGSLWKDIWLRGVISEGFGKAPISRPNGHIGSSWNDIWPSGGGYRGLYRTHTVI
jgi:hypothetical protein